MKSYISSLFLLVLFVAIYACTPNSSNQSLSLPDIIQDGMVIQRDTEVAIWGWANPGDNIKLNSSWGETNTTITNSDGSWNTTIKGVAAGGPHTISIKNGTLEITIKDVLSGEVWLASGQSNMAMPLKGWPPNDTIDYSAREIENADFPEIRMITVERALSAEPLKTFQGNWKICTPANAADFSATAYFFARKVHQELGIPVGIIHTSWGGTPAESWVSSSSLRKLGDFNSDLDRLSEMVKDIDRTRDWLNELKKTSVAAEDMTSVDLEDQALKELSHVDAAWLTMSLPAMWESEPIGAFDGMVWFRKTIELDELPSEDVELHLGAIDDMDITYVNGQLVGQTLEPGNYQEPRKYSVPTGVLRQGENVIAIKVFDSGGGGGIYSGEMRLGDIPLDGIWKYLPTGELRNGQVLHLGTDGKALANRPPVFLDQYKPSVLYNAMIHPVIDYSFKGAIWYQGESNVGMEKQYESLFPALITDWREIAGDTFPFYFVRIAPFTYGDITGNTSAALRDAQRKTLTLPNTGMVVTMDIGNVTNIHPGNKQDVGGRLALQALGQTYGDESVNYSGPLPSVVDVNSNELHVSFQYATGGLTLKSGGEFEVAGADEVYYPANIKVEDNELIFSSPQVDSPVSARYAWKNVTEAYLFDSDGLPASSFLIKIE